MKMPELSKNSKIIEKVAKYCHSRLLSDAAAMAYLKDKRQLNEKVIEDFQIGLFPQDLRELFELSDPKDLREAYVIKHASKSMFRTWDLITPIRDVYGRCVALAGRTRLSEKERKKRNIPKYINSQYSKKNHLYGLYLAKRSILETGVVYVVEGYYDVITPFQHNMTNIVGVCGASFSTKQMALLSRYTNKIVLLFDNEVEAEERAKKIVEKKRRDNITLISRNPFPSHIKDIDDFLKEYSVLDLQDKLDADGEYDNIVPLWD